MIVFLTVKEIVMSNVKLEGEYRVIQIPDTNQGVGVLEPMEKEESVLDKISYWDKVGKKRYQIYFTINFFVKGLPNLKMESVPDRLKFKNGKLTLTDK